MVDINNLTEREGSMSMKISLRKVPVKEIEPSLTREQILMARARDLYREFYITGDNDTLEEYRSILLTIDRTRKARGVEVAVVIRL